jgi:regulator of replication initiation timing
MCRFKSGDIRTHNCIVNLSNQVKSLEKENFNLRKENKRLNQSNVSLRLNKKQIKEELELKNKKYIIIIFSAELSCLLSNMKFKN